MGGRCSYWPSLNLFSGAVDEGLIVYRDTVEIVVTELVMIDIDVHPSYEPEFLHNNSNKSWWVAYSEIA